MIKGLKLGFWFGFLALLTLSTAAAAATPSQASRSSSQAPQAVEQAPLLYLSAAINQGTASLSNPVPGAQSSSGAHTELLLLATVELGNLVIEAGGGWMHDRISGTAQPTGFSPTAYELTTDAGIAELSPRYKIVGGLELGPLVELLYGSDVGFSPGFISSGPSTAWLGGAQMLYGFKLSGTAVRAGARYVQSLNIANHTLQSVQATLQLGLPVL